MSCITRCIGLSVAVAFSAVAFAQGTYPSKPVRIVIGFAAGGNPDVTARLVGQKLSEQWGQQVVVENRTGSNGNIAAEQVARSAPDGYTLLCSDTTTFSINPHLYSKLSFDPVPRFHAAGADGGAADVRGGESLAADYFDPRTD